MEAPQTSMEYATLQLRVFDQMQNWLNSDGWEPFHKEENVTLECSPMVGSSIKAQKGTVILSGSKFDQFTEKLFNPPFDERKKIYPEIQSEVIVKHINEDTFISHTKFDAPWPVYPREFLVIKARKTLDDGSQLITAYSIEDPEVPVSSGFVRGALQTGMIVSKLPGNRVKVVKVEHIDPCGSIPTSLVQDKQMKNAYRLATMQAYLD
jgi:hypothetical protein